MAGPGQQKTDQELITERHARALRRGLHHWPGMAEPPPALGDRRWTADLILSTWRQAETGLPPDGRWEYRIGNSGGGFDRLAFRVPAASQWLPAETPIDLTIPLNRRSQDARIDLPVPWYGAGMSFGSISEQVMLARAMAAQGWSTFTCTGEAAIPRR